MAEIPWSSKATITAAQLADTDRIMLFRPSQVVIGNKNATIPKSQLDLVYGTVDSVVAGTNISVDNTDPQNPIINATATLAATLVIGNITGGTDIVISNGDRIISPNDTTGVALNIGSGNGTVSGGGNLNLLAGSATVGVGGQANLTAGLGGSTSGVGGIVNIAGGDAVASDTSGGKVFIDGGIGTGTGVDGAIFLGLGGSQVSIGSTGPEISAILDVFSITQGFLPPRMTTTQRDAIVTPVTGLTIYNTTNLELETYNGTIWVVGALKQTATGDGTTTIDWGLGSQFDFTFGAQNDVLTFTDPPNDTIIYLSLLQDSIGSRTITWPASVKWPGGTAPTLTTTATTGYDLIRLRFDGTNYYGTFDLNFS